tara:strand:+ start:225 stop:758 length:534 start_codon:yes stop_codon:yes gene_type:complete
MPSSQNELLLIQKKKVETPIELEEAKCDEWMKILLARAELCGSNGEVPVAAVILDKHGHCIGHGSNRREHERNPLSHAELVALRQASWIKNDWRFNDCTLIVTLEPCPMCAGALIQARMGQIIFAASDSKRGALGGCLKLDTHPSSHHKMIVKSGIRKEDASKQLTNWFKQQVRNYS